MFKTKKQFTEKSEEMRDRHNDSGQRYANNIRAGVNFIKIIDDLYDKTSNEIKDKLLNLKTKWLDVLLSEMEYYTEHTIEVDKYNRHKQNLILIELKEYNKLLPELKNIKDL